MCPKILSNFQSTSTLAPTLATPPPSPSPLAAPTTSGSGTSRLRRSPVPRLRRRVKTDMGIYKTIYKCSIFLKSAAWLPAVHHWADWPTHIVQLLGRHGIVSLGKPEVVDTNLSIV